MFEFKRACTLAVYLVSWLLLFTAKLFAQTAPDEVPKMTPENGYIAPFQLFDNLYYVGDQWVSAFLLKTNKGLILIDTLEFPFSKWLPTNIEQLGFSPDNIKAILITHAHSDHVGGAGYMQALTAAQVVMLEEDLALLKQQAKKNQFPTPKIDLFPEDGDHFNLGSTRITLYKTPGHTEGCMSLEFSVFDNGKPLRAFVVCGNGTNFQGIDLARKYVKSVKRTKALANASPNITVNLSTHPHLGQLIARHKNRGNKDTANPFIDREGFNQFLSLLQERGRKKLKLELDKYNKP